MAIFHEAYTDAIIVLNEKKTREQYARESFKKKYKFEPSKEDPNIGTITDKSGKKYKVDMRKNNMMNIGGVNIKRQTMADLSSKDSQINLDKNFFKLKGSNKGERRDATLQHEIGHQNLHNMNPENKTVDKKNRNMAVYKNTVKNIVKDQSGVDISKNSPFLSKEENHDIRKQINDRGDTAAKYASSVSKDKEESKQRRADQAAAKKFEKQSSHANAEEYEADRFSANRTSANAVKKGIRNTYKIVKNDKDFKNNPNENIKKSRIKNFDTDMNQRSKALKDEDMRKAKSFK